MHKATCDDCGNKCEVPFKPTGSKPIYCSNCFKGKDDDNRSRGRNQRSGGRSDRYSDRRSDRQSFKATCDDCGSRCEVPFRPSGDKPIFCDKCFGGKRGSGSGRGGSDQFEKQFEILNTKLDKILKMITPTVTVDLKKETEEPKKAKKETKKKATTKKKVVTKKKAPAKKKSTTKKPAKKKAPAKKKK